MRIQIILNGGPFDGTFTSIGTVEGEAPTKIRVASGDDHADPLEAHDYRRHDVDQEGVIWMGSYKFTHSFESARSLVDHWL